MKRSEEDLRAEDIADLRDADTKRAYEDLAKAKHEIARLDDEIARAVGLLEPLRDQGDAVNAALRVLLREDAE